MSESTGGRLDPADAALLDRLRPLVAGDDPVPPEVVAAAHATSTWRRIDEELAELVEDSLDLAAGVRGGAARLLTYRAGELTIEVEVSTVDERVRILGQLVPPRAARVRIEQVPNTVEVVADDLGRFRAAGLDHGSTRLCVTPRGPDGTPAEPVCTQWTLW